MSNPKILSAALGLWLIAAPVRAQESLDCSQLAFWGGEARALAAEGGRLGFSRGGTVFWVDAHQPENLALLGELTLPAPIEMLRLRGNRALALADGTMYLLDLTDPAHPLRLAETAVPGVPLDLDLDARFAYAALADQGLHSYGPVDQGRLDDLGSTHFFAWAEGVDVVDSLAYLSCCIFDFQVVDLHEPATPVRLSLHDASGHFGRLLASPPWVYLLDQLGSLRVFEVGDPAQPRQVDSLATSGQPRALARCGSTLLLNEHDAGVEFVDLTDPAHPASLGRDASLTRTLDLAAEASTAFLLDSQTGCLSLDLGDPSLPMRLDTLQVDCRVDDVTRRGGFAYAAAGEAGLRIWELSDPARPATLALLPLPGHARNLLLLDDWACLTGSAGLFVVDIHDPRHPVLAAERAGNAGRLAALGNRLFVHELGVGVQELELDAGGQPVWLGTLPLTTQCTDLDLADGLLALSDGEAGLRLFDVGTPGAPLELGRLEAFGPAQSLALLNGFAYLADAQQGLLEVDIHDPAQPELRRLIPGLGQIRDLCAADSSLYLAVADFGLKVLDPARPAEEIVQGYLETDSLLRLQAEGGVVLAASGEHGLHILRDERPVAVGETQPARPRETRLANHPNPFNPGTRLEFTLPRAQPVRLSVHDLQGRLVRVLQDGPLPAGPHQLDFDGGGLPSGVYLSHLEGEGISWSGKMLLIR